MPDLNPQTQNLLSIAEERLRQQESGDASKSVDQNIPTQEMLLVAQERLREQGGETVETAETDGGLVDSFARNVAEPFNRGVLSLIEAPVDIANLALQGASAIGIGPEEPFQLEKPITAGAQKLGVIAKPEDRATGFLSRTSEIAGGAVVPVGATIQLGKQLLKAPTSIKTVFQEIMAMTARRPGAVVASEVGLSAASAAGGEIARQFTDDPTVIALAELAGGFSPFLIANAPGAQLARAAGRKTVEAVAPFTAAGAEPRAARRLQSLAADPEQAAARIGETPELSPARQTGDPRLLALEEKVLAADPKLDAKFSQELITARQQLRDSATFGGDPDRARRLLEVRAQQAAEEAQNAISRLDPDATPREISSVARRHLNEALSDARAIERSLWKSVDQNVPAEMSTARQTLKTELSSRGKFDNPDDIPPWLREALAPQDIPDATRNQLAKAGLIDSKGDILPAVKKSLEQQGVLAQAPVTFKDLQTLRSRTLGEIRAERAQVAPNRNKIRVLSNIEESLLDDMATANLPGVQEARSFSHALNQKFTQGRIGQLLGFERRGSLAVSPEDTLQSVITGREPASTMRRFIETNSEAPEQALDFIRGSYLDSVVTKPGNTVDLAAHNRFLTNLRKKGLFELFPELEAELISVSTSANAAQQLAVTGNPLMRLSGQSKASLFLNSPVGEEMDILLRSRNSVAIAESVVRRMNGDPKALQGLKTAFIESVMKGSVSKITPDGHDILSGASVTKQLRQNTQTMRALGFTEDDIARTNDIARRLRVAEATPGKQEVKGIIEDTPSAILDLLARWVGAQSGSRVANISAGGSSIGSSLVMSQAFSKKMRDSLGSLTRDRAREIIVSAHSDPELYQALLIRPQDSAKKQAEAARILNTWMIGSTVSADDVQEQQ